MRHPVVPATLFHQDDRVRLFHGDCLAELCADELGYDRRLGYHPPRFADESIDAVVTDPPYGLGFMGKEWDALPPGEDWARECMRVLKPGGHLLAFGGTRTWHRLAVAVEDSGFEIRDSIAWMYGSGFPKSLDVSKAIDRAAGVEGAWRREDHPGRAGARIPHGTILNQTDHTREDNPDGLRHVYIPTEHGAPWEGWGTALKPAFEPIIVARKPIVGTVAANVLTHGTGALNIDACRIEGEPVVTFDRVAGDRSREDWRTGTGENRSTTNRGRWPANLVLDGSQADELDEQSGTLTSGANPTRRGSDKFRDAYGEFSGQEECTAHRGPDTGGASRFFYVAKADAAERVRVAGVSHPTVKPLALMRWLVRLVTPPGGTVLEPFAGSGTTVEACVLEGFRCIAIENEVTYLPLIMQRINRRRDPVAAVTATQEDIGLFGLLSVEEAS